MRNLERPNDVESLVGLVGNAACGKDTVGGIFEEFGYVHQSASDLVREEIRSRGLEPSRKLQTAVANEVRKTQGDTHFVAAALSRAIEHASFSGRAVISGLYAPSEGRYVRSEGGVIVALAGVKDETLQARYARVVGRSSGPEDFMSYDEFVASYRMENGGENEDEANVGELVAMSDYTIEHNGEREQILPTVKEIVGAI